MKQSKRLAALMMALVMLLGIFPLSAVASDLKNTLAKENAVTPSFENSSAEALTLETAKTVDIPAGESVLLSFTAPEDGYYQFTSIGNNDTVASIFDQDQSFVESDDDSGDGNNFALVYRMTQGDTVYLSVRFWENYLSDSTDILVTKKVAPSSLSFLPDQALKTTVGNICYSLKAVFGPENAVAEDVLCTSSDPEVIDLLDTEKNIFTSVVECYLVPRSEGSATITLTSENGLTASVSVTVLPATPLQTDNTTYTLPEGTSGMTIAIPVTEKGYYDYSFDSPDEWSYDRVLVNSSFDYVSSNENDQYDLEAGTYYFAIQVDQNELDIRSFEFDWEKLVPATAMSIVLSQSTGIIGDYIYVGCEFSPENAVREHYTLTSSNPEVAKFETEDSPYLELLSVGSTTITATSKNGLTNSIEFTVTDKPTAEILELSHSDGSLAFVGTSQIIDAYFYPNECATEEITWTSSDPTVAVVTTDPEDSSRTKVSFLRSGDVEITATSQNGLTASCSFSIYNFYHLTETGSISLDFEYEEKKVLKFTPSEQNWYHITSQQEIDGIYFAIFDETMDYIGDGDAYIDFEAEKDSSYYILITSYCEDPVFATFYASKMVKATGIVLPESISGYETLMELLQPTFTPANAIPESVTYRSANTDVVDVDEEGYLFFASPGTTTVTVTSEGGLTATVTVTVLAAQVLVQDTPKTVSIEPEKPQVLKFVPEANGHYAFDGTADAPVNCCLYDENGVYLFEAYYYYDFTKQAKLEAGKAYYLLATCNEEYPNADLTVTVSKMAVPTFVSLEHENRIYTGNEILFSPVFGPEGCYEEECILTVSDPEAIEVSGYWLTFHRAGTFTVTATSESGLTVSTTVTVIDIPTITLDEQVQSEIPANEGYVIYQFTPEKSGNYSLSFTNTAELGIEISDTEFYFYVTSERSRFNFYLEKDECYKFYLYDQSENDESIPFTFILTNAIAINTLEIVAEPNQTVYFKGYEEFNFFGLKLKATLTDGSTAYYLCGEDDYLAGYAVQISNKWDDDDNYLCTDIRCGDKTVEYKFTIVENPVDHLELVEGSKITYVENTDGYFNGSHFLYHTTFPSDAKVKVVYKDHSEKIVTLGESPDYSYRFEWDERQHESPWKVGTNDTVVYYLGKALTLPITVHPTTVEKIELVQGSLTLYENSYGDRENDFFYYYYDVPEDTQIKIYYKNGSEKVVPYYDENGFTIFEDATAQYDDPWKVGGDNFLTISLQGSTCKLPVQILENPVDRIELLQASDFVYYYGDTGFGAMRNGKYYLYSPYMVGLSLRIHYKNGTHKDILWDELGDSMYNGYYVDGSFSQGPHEIGTHTVTVTYAEKSLTYTATLKECPVSSLSVKKLPAAAKTSPCFSPDFIGTQFLVAFKNGTEQTITVTEENLISTSNDRYFFVLTDESIMEIALDDDTEKWVASYMGASTVIEMQKDAKVVQKAELLHFDPNIAGTQFKLTYTDQSTQTITVQEATYNVYGFYAYGSVKTELGFSYFELAYYNDERAYGILQLYFGEFIFSLQGSNDQIGNLNGDDVVDMDDAIYLLFHTFYEDDYPLNQSCDFDHSGYVDMDDAIYLLFHTFYPSDYPLS